MMMTVPAAGDAHQPRLKVKKLVVELQPLFSGDYMVLLRSGAKLKLSRSYRQSVEARLRGTGPD